MAKRKIQKRRQHEATKKLAKQLREEKKVMADQKEDVVGNNGEKVVTPEEKAYVEDTRKPEPEPIPVFDPKKLVDEILKEYGV